MSFPDNHGLKTLQFYSTASYPCSYLPGLQARSQVAAPTHLIDNTLYSRLVENGFRRSGLFTYRPLCDQCKACISIRINVGLFAPNRTQRKTWKHHQSISTRVLPLHWSPEHFELYHRYQRTRHAGDPDDDTEAQYSQFLLASRVNSRLIEFRDAGGLLKMVSIIDLLDDGWSSVYTFFDPDDTSGLGTYGVLWQIDQCRQRGLPWLYLGYWIQESRKMSYKARFKPHELLINGHWRTPHDTPVS